MSATVTSPGEDTDSNEKVDTVAAPKSPTPEVLSKDPPDMKNKGDSSTLNIDFEVKGGYKTTQSLKVSMNGEELMATSRLNSGHRYAIQPGRLPWPRDGQFERHGHRSKA